jgi:hypothetical protein
LTPRSALSALGRVLDALSIRWTLIGALAANRYRGSPRSTNDVDLLLADTGEGLESLEAALTAAGWSVRRADSAGELLRLSHAEYGVADLLIAGTDYQSQAIERSVVEPFDAHESARVLTAEDVIVHKLIAGRLQDLADVEAILEGGVALDEGYIERWAQFWEVGDRWEQLRRP